MKVVYFGNDLFSGCLTTLIENAHTIIRVYINEPLNNAHNIVKICQRYQIPFYTHKPNPKELDELAAASADMFLVAEYQHKIPTTGVKYAINIHPSLLPLGRSATPLAYLLQYPEAAGISLHKLENTFDTGDVISQASLALSADDSLNSLTYKLHNLAQPLLQTFLNNIEHLYTKAQPQDETQSSYWPTPTQTERTIDFNLSAQQLKKLHRQYGHYGVFFTYNTGSLLKTGHTSQIEFIHEQPNVSPGEVAFEDHNLLIYACADALVIFEKKHVQLI